MRSTNARESTDDDFETLRVEDPTVEIEISEKLKVDRLVYRQIDQ